MTAPNLPNSAAAELPAWMAWISRHRGLLLPIGLVLMLGVIVVPLPPWTLDLLIVMNIGLSVTVLMTTIYMREPLDFSVFPSLLLAMTLFRLVLNVASTRLILTADAPTPDSAVNVAGEVIAAFGHFVAGESLIVGVIIFLILVIVQFVVITKGATRISEVAARFTLDAMPGKQMAIDADLNAGIINEAEARRRRERIGREADFFGAMDGASKFVRGDAIAGLIITAVNLVGGILIGTLQRGWDFSQTTETITKLTIGDGLTSQLPAFIVAISSALIVTRSGSKEELGSELTGQVVSQPTGLMITGGFLASLSVTPLPTTPLLLGASLCFLMAWAMTDRERRARRKAREQGAAPPSRPEPPTPEALLKLDTIELEVGYGLVSLVDANQGGDLLERIAAIRRQLAVELGFILPPVRIRDNLQLPSGDYRFRIKGSVVARGTIVPGRLLAIDSGVTTGPIDGIQGREPAFGLDAWWIEPALKSRAEAQNFTVAEPTAVVATHLTEVVRANASDLLTREEVNDLIGQLKQRAPKLVEEVVPTVVKMGDLHRILQNLLRERVPIRDLETILETLSDWASRTKDLDVLTEYVRNALRRTISQQYAVPDADGRLRLACITLDPTMEDLINGYIDRSASGTNFTMPAHVASRVTSQLLKGIQVLTGAGHQPVVIASPMVRAFVRQLLEGQVPNAAVLGYNEVASGVEVESLALVTAPPSGGTPAGVSAA
jgi:flagellar biosynthesis protein FlhA